MLILWFWLEHNQFQKKYLVRMMVTQRKEWVIEVWCWWRRADSFSLHENQFVRIWWTNLIPSCCFVHSYFFNDCQSCIQRETILSMCSHVRVRKIIDALHSDDDDDWLGDEMVRILLLLFAMKRSGRKEHKNNNYEKNVLTNKHRRFDVMVTNPASNHGE